MKLNVITFFIAVIGALAYIEHTKHDHYGVEPIPNVVPAKSAELLEFIDGCEKQGLIVTPIDDVTVSCSRG